ncbi:ABC-three component system protein [Bacillus paranthracis]
MSDTFSASSQALGYLYQIRLALYLAMKDENIDKDLGIELLDDVSFHSEGTPLELIQVKHHLKKEASLTDGSLDLWKTIRVWSEAVKESKVEVPGVIFTLITTATASEGTVAFYLRDDKNRNPQLAMEKLMDFAQKSKSENQKNFDAFRNLNDEKRFELVKSIYIMDATSNIVDVTQLIKRRLTLSTRKIHLDALLERVEGWWFNRTVDVLLNNSKEEIIYGDEVHNKITEVSEELRADSLPIDYRNDEPPELNPENDQRLFVKQLRLIDLSNRRISHAIKDFYRASEQRSRWFRNGLLVPGELEKYEGILLEEWERKFERILEDIPEDESNLNKHGKKLYNWMEDAQIHIRKNCTEAYVMRGSYHMLTNEKNKGVGWHPQFEEKLKNISIP